MHPLISTFGDDDGLGDAILDGAVVRVNEILEEAKASFQERGEVAECAFG